MLAKLMVLLRQILSNPVNAAITETILTRISAEQMPSLQRVTSRYLKLVTPSNFWPVMLISALRLFMLLVLTLL